MKDYKEHLISLGFKEVKSNTDSLIFGKYSGHN